RARYRFPLPPWRCSPCALPTRSIRLPLHPRLAPHSCFIHARDLLPICSPFCEEDSTGGARPRAPPQRFAPALPSRLDIGGFGNGRPFLDFLFLEGGQGIRPVARDLDAQALQLAPDGRHLERL